MLEWFRVFLEVMMNKIDWCRKQKKGIELVERKHHLSEAYMGDADESLEVCLNNKGKWKVISGYYACYNAFYSILMKCGVKCEIHDCTIELMKFFNFNDEDINFLKNLKEKRIQTQYYLKNVDEEEIKVKKFIDLCREILISLNDNEIEKIRREIDEI